MGARIPVYDAWHPGLRSELPGELLPLVTLFRPEISEVDYTEAKELSDFCGLDPAELVSFRADRLVQHELLIWVTANLSVPDGPNYEELGINLRSIVATIFDVYIKPGNAAVRQAYDSARSDAMAFIAQELASKLSDRSSGKPAKSENRSFLGRLFGKGASVVKPKTMPENPEIEAIDLWRKQLAGAESSLERACLEGLIKIVGGIVGHRGRLIPDRELITRLTANFVCSHYSSEKIAEAIEPLMKRAIAEEKYRILPIQQKPTVMNVKGASAAGKSTIRPQQRRLAEKLGIPWEDFAVISPDYWRKYLLDYGSLGENYKYAAMLTGQELEIIDKKLDRYMAKKASRGEMSHLLIDRFRFDSFVVEGGRSTDNKLLTRFGDQIFMFFMITPPDETVERAWQRGIKTGRYKAVDDLLYHNVEAFTGMPGLFFSWVRSREKRVHFEFLDNDVPEGALPKTSAFGWNDTMTILDVGVMINIDRFRKVNIEAKQPDQIFKVDDMAAERNVGFLRRCADQIPEINFADQSSGYIFARMVDGELIWFDRQYIEEQAPQSGIKIALEALGYDGNSRDEKIHDSIEPIDIEKEKHFTLGRWNAV
jgi:hypothetical protein